jgi:hypothetical protein
VKHARLLLGLLLLSWVSPAHAVKVFEDKEKGIVVNVGTLLQPWMQMTAPGGGTERTEGAPCGPAGRVSCSANIGNPEGDGPSFDFFLRRARLMLWGSVTKELSFFIDTDQANWGKNGQFNQAMVVQDAFFSYAFMPEFKIDAGMMLVPLSHHTLEGATSLNALDYHSDLIRFPAGHTFRDIGVQFRGLLANDFLHYRVGIFNGVRQNAVVPPAMPPATPPPPVNDMGLPRVTGQLRANLLGSEPDFFLKGIYFTETPIVSVGLGLDYQPNALIRAPNRRRNYFAGSFDVFVDYPFSADDELIVKANLFYWSIGASGLGGAAVNTRPQGAISGYVEAGFRHGWVEPLVFVEYLQEPSGEAGARKLLAPHVGVNFWAMKHTFNIKTDVGYRVQTSAEDLDPAPPAIRDIFWTTQGQVFF